jgi:outer membrane protein TolC
LAAEQSDLQLANLRVDLARTQYEEARRKADVGVIKREDLADAAADLQAMESNVARIRLNVEEIRETAKPPRDDLSAPLVGSRDFVKARLELELAAAQKRLTAAEAIAAESGRGFDAGVVPRLVLLDARAQLARSKAEMGVLAGKLDLRAQFLQHKLEPADVARRSQRLELVQNLDVAQHLHELAEERLIKVRQMWNVGAAEKVDVLRAELEASEQNADIQRIQRNLELLDRARP